MTYKETIYDVVTGETTFRDYTAKEVKEAEEAQLKGETEAQAAIAKASEKAALLAKLGITDDEAKLLLS
jgi:hypothetical protein